MNGVVEPGAQSQSVEYEQSGAEGGAGFIGLCEKKKALDWK